MLLFQELHPDFHNLKLRGENIFEKNLEELKNGTVFSELCNEYVPKTLEDQARVDARKQLTKEQLFSKLTKNIKEAISEFHNDDFLTELSDKIDGKTHKIFRTKNELVELSLSFDQHLDNLVTDREYLMYLPDIVEFDD